MPSNSLNVSAWTLQDEPSEPRKVFLELPPVWHTIRPRSADVPVDVAEVVWVVVPVVVCDVLVCNVLVADVVAVVVTVDESEFDCVVVMVELAVLVTVDVPVLESEVVAVVVKDDVAVDVMDVVAVVATVDVADDVWVVVTVVFLHCEKAPPVCVPMASFRAFTAFWHVSSPSTFKMRVSELHTTELLKLVSSSQCATRSERRVAVVLHSVNECVLRSTCRNPIPSTFTHLVSPWAPSPPGQSSMSLLMIGVCSPQSSFSLMTKKCVVLPSSGSHIILGNTAVVTVVVPDVVAVVVAVLDADDVAVLVAVVFSQL